MAPNRVAPADEDYSACPRVRRARTAVASPDRPGCIGFAMIFGMSSTLLHSIMIASLTALIGVLLFVSIAIDHPFAGDIAVAPTPLERVLSDFESP
jgi:hypothetical protein